MSASSCIAGVRQPYHAAAMHPPSSPPILMKAPGEHQGRLPTQQPWFLLTLLQELRTSKGFAGVL